MNHCVPDFELDDDCSIPTSSSFLNRSKRSAMAEDDIMELLWHNGQVVVQSQNQRSLKKSPPSRHGDTVIAADQSTPSHVGSSHPQQQLHHHHHQQNPEHMFMQEDEMASWLQYPLNDTNFDSDFCADLLYPTPCVTSTSTAVAAQLIESPQMNSTVSASVSAPRPPIPPPRRMENFGIFSRHRARAEPSNPKSAVVRESTVVESNDTPVTGPVSRVSEAMRSTDAVTGVHNVQGTMSSAGAAGTSSAAGSGGTKDLACGGGGGMKDSATCELTVTSSPGGSSASAEPGQKASTEDRKRKGRDAGDDECHSEDIEFESADTKKQTRGSTSTKRSRAAEVHNLSERRRRDRINEKMRALQELIPRCNKSDKASMLDEAIEYLKSLQLQVQMMSMGCGMVPMMFPGIQQYMPAMGMGMGMAMGMEMGMSRPMMPFPNVIPGTAMPTPGAAAHLAPRFPIPQFSMPAVPVQDPSRAQATNQPDPMLHSFMQNPSQPRMPNFSDPYQHYLGLHQMQLPLQQNQSMSQPSPSKPSSSSKGSENPDNHPSG